ncbi:unnamed protein product [Pichia kudriavzevii]
MRFDVNTTRILEMIPEDTLKGKNVLVLGAGTSVGAFTLQFAKRYYLASNVVGTCSPLSVEKAQKYGADIFINYNNFSAFKMDKLLAFLKDNGKFDIIVDTVGDESVMDYFSQLLKPAEEYGVYTQVAGSKVIDYSNVRITDLLPSWKKVCKRLKSNLGMFDFKIVEIFLARNQGYIEIVNQLGEENPLDFSIDSINDAYTESQKALEIVAPGKAKGKVVLQF